MEELKDREEVLRLKEQALDSKRAKLQAKDSWFFWCSDSPSSAILSDLIEKYSTMWKLNKATDDEVQFLLDELNEKRLRIIEGKAHGILRNTESGLHRYCWRMLETNCVGDGVGDFSHQHPLSLNISVEHQHPKDVTKILILSPTF